MGYFTNLYLDLAEEGMSKAEVLRQGRQIAPDFSGFFERLLDGDSVFMKNFHNKMEPVLALDDAWLRKYAGSRVYVRTLTARWKWERDPA